MKQPTTSCLALAEPRSDLTARIGYTFANENLLDEALRHRSWCAENGRPRSNERLEFIGDAVLQLVVTEKLFLSQPNAVEGTLARQRAATVNTVALAQAANELGLGSYILLGRGESSTGGASKPSILADCLEAVIGAVYLDGGHRAAQGFVVPLLGPQIESVIRGDKITDPKSSLQELAAREFQWVPRYEVTSTGPDHARLFDATVFGPEGPLGTGVGSSKKESEQAAALMALGRLCEES